MRQLALCLIALALTSVNVAVAAPMPETREYTLDNGLKLIVRPDHRAPVVVSQIWYKVGSSYEPRGLTGVSHVLEHMMFKGTKKHAPGEFSRIVALNGGRENAFTSRDYTSYYQQLANDRLAIAFELEADRMLNIQLDQAEFDKELQVVIEERRLRTDDDPISLAIERFNTVAYPLNPYRNPVIGWPEDLKSLKLGDLKTWYQRWYTPSNATLVVAGDVDPAAVLKLAQKYFGKLPTHPVTAPKPAPSLEDAGPRRITQRLPAHLPYLAIAYQTPSLATAQDKSEAYALMVLESILDGGESARFASDLIRGQEVAAGVGADYSGTMRLDTLFSVSGYPAREKTLDQLEAAVTEEIERVREEPVSADELERAKNQIVADHLYQLDSIFYQAMQIGILETTGIGWRTLQDYERNIRAVTAEQVQAVAKKYLTDDRRTVMHLIPVDAKQGGQG